MSIHRTTTVRAGVNRKRHRDCVHMRPEYFDGMQMHEDLTVMAALRWEICGPLHVVDGSPLYEDPAEVRSTDRPCALDIYNTTRSFTHGSNTCVIRRSAFLILGFIDPLSCIPPPTTLLTTLFGRGARSWYSPRMQELLKYKRTSVGFSALPSVCAQRRACATIPRPTFSSYNPELLSAFSMILSERAPSFFNLRVFIKE